MVAWLDVWQRTGLAPFNVPGVQELPESKISPFSHRVHLTHLPLLGFQTPPALGAALPPASGLRPHQIAGVNYIRSRRGTLLADEQRVGKTPQIMYSHEPDSGTLVIVGPLAARAVWHEWSARRFGHCQKQECSICSRLNVEWKLQPSFVAGVGRTFAAPTDVPKVLFCHYAIVPSWRELFAHIPIGTLAVDEAHLAGIQNRGSITVESIRWLNTVAKRAIFATGTPLYNKPRGLWPILDIITPGAFGKFWDFARRYCDARPGAHGWSANGASNLDELTVRLSEVMLRRRWSDIQADLPPINRSIEIVALPDAKRDAVEDLCARMRSAEGSRKTLIGDLARLRKLYAQEKAAAGIKIVVDRVCDGYKTIAWTWHRDVAETVTRALADRGVRPFGPIHGDMPTDEREEVIEQARNYPGPCALIASMAALSTAVDLSFAPREVFVELDWSPTNIAQAEMRPFNGKQPIDVTYLVADCDSDQKLIDALIVKLDLMNKLGLDAGVGSVESVLRDSLGVESVATLSALADAVMAEAG